MTTRWTPRRVATGIGRRAKRWATGSPADGSEQRRRNGPPAISVIVPIYNVESYLRECLDSILAQSVADFEVVVVDDGSPDGSADIAAEYAERDARVKLVARPNGGLGAARNTGVEHATGDFLTFLDSDDRLPDGALRTMLASARTSGSDIVVGALRRFNSSSNWLPTWVDRLHGEQRRGIAIDDFPPLVRNNYSCGKLFRRDFWVGQEATFREGVAYEDQPLITRLYIAADRIDICPQVTYDYRAREDASSISQQTATLADLRDRVTAWQESRREFADTASERVYDAWLQTLFDDHFHWYLRSPGTVDLSYWATLRDAIVSLTEDAPQSIWDATAPERRVPIVLARSNRRADVQEYVRSDGYRPSKFPATVVDGGVFHELPLHDAPGLDRSLFVRRPEQLTMSHSVQRLHWTDGSTMHLAGWAYIRHVDLVGREVETELVLRNTRTGAEHTFCSPGCDDPGFPPPDEDDWVEYDGGQFEFVVPMEDVVGADRSDGDVWDVRLRVSTLGFTVEDTVSRVRRSSSPGAPSPGRLANGDLIAVKWHLHAPFQLALRTLRVEADELALTKRVLRGTLGGPDASSVREVRLLGPAGRVVESTTPQDGNFALRIPTVALNHDTPAAPHRSRVVAELADGQVVPVAWRSEEAAQTGTTQVLPTSALAVEGNRLGELGLVEWLMAAYADSVEVLDGGVARVSGRVLGPNVESVALALKSKKTEIRSEQSPVDDTHFVIELALKYDAYRFGELPLPRGNHDLTAEVRVASGEDPIAVPLLVSRELNDALPLRVESKQLEGVVERGVANMVRFSLRRPLGSASGKCRQNRLRAASGEQFIINGRRRGLLIRSYFGEQATDSGVGLQRELQRRGADIDIYWSVQDHSIPVPDGATAVIQNSYEWYGLLNTAKYYLDNMYQPAYHRKPDGQVIIQTFHGYPFKTMGHQHWEQSQFSQAQIESYDARARDWDYLVSPASYATPLLKRDFAYDGEVLEIGYPRNDILFAPEGAQIRSEVRKLLGVADHQTAVLYAPTFRDYLSPDDMRAEMVDFLDLQRASAALGDDYVILVRGHAFNARTASRIGALAGVVDVTDYPRVADLYLAADAAIVDYSSLRFDFGVTGKPMIFQVPDLDRYKATRGWLFDFEPTAPGPLVSTTDEVVETLLDLDVVTKQYRNAYNTFRHAYLDLEDGHAAARLVDAVFVPRGDAPPA